MEKNPSETDTNHFRYCGEYWDAETETYYLRARYYDPALGRFTQQDTHWNTANMIYGDNPQKINEREDRLGLKSYSFAPQISAVLQSGNLYVYCVNNPVVYVDYTGQKVSLLAELWFYATASIPQRILRSSNYADNIAAEEKNPTFGTLINNQNSFKDGSFKMGSYNASYNGCGAIALHNAKVLLGIDSTLTETINDIHLSKALKYGGILGIDPRDIGTVLFNSGIDYSLLWQKDFSKKGVYIIEYFHSKNIFDGAHFVTFVYDGKNYTTYNLKCDGDIYIGDPNNYIGAFALGYYLGEI